MQVKGGRAERERQSTNTGERIAIVIIGGGRFMGLGR